jgi:hypothetical protein
VTRVNVDGEPQDRHDLRCAVWTSNDPCTCRDGHGKAPRDVFEVRAHAERAWDAMTLCERAEEIDRITAGGAA